MHLIALCVATAAAGCTQAPVKRFQHATRVDAAINPGWWEFEEPFAAHFAKLKESRGAACQDQASLDRIYDILSQYKSGWIEYWATQPESPPVTLRFHDQTEWLGTLDVYEAALGLVGNRIRRVPRDEAARILEIICNCPTTDTNPTPTDRY